MKKNPGMVFPARGKLSKILFVVRLKYFLILFSCFQLNAAVHSQNNVRISLDLENVSLEQVIWEIQKKTDFVFMYGTRDIEGVKQLTVQETDKEVNEILKTCLKNTGLWFEISGNAVVIKKEVTATEGRKITGKVVDEKGNPLPGVTVIIKGTSLGTVTSVEGEFTITLPVADGQALLFSFVGMETMEVKITDKNDYKIVLKEDVKALDDVVVTGYFNKNKDSFTGAQVTVKGDELRKVTTGNVLQALSVFDPSIRFEDNIDIGSNPNRIADFTIRGNSGIGLTEFEKEAVSRDNLKNNPNLPTFIMDGFEVDAEKIFDLDIERIESLTILKDASATAIYGSRAANGVIVIKTKAPSEGQLRVNYNFTASIAIPDLNGYDLLDAREKLDFEKSIGMYKDNNADAQINKDKDYNYKLSLVESGVNTYWLSQPLKVEFNQKHSIFIEGGDKAVRYGIDFKYDKDNGVMKGSARDRGALGFSLSYNLKDKLLVRNYLTVNKVKSKESPYGDFSQYALLNPYYPFQDEHGNLIRKMTQYINTNKQIWNPVYEATVGNRDESEYLDVTNNFSLEWSIVQGLRLRANFSYGEKKEQVETFISPESLQYESYELSSGEGLLNKGEGYHGTSNTYSMDFNSVLTYYLGVGKHFINTALGVNLTESGSRSVNFDVRGYPSKMMDYISLAKEFTNTHPGGSEGKTRLAGFFANVNYSYANRYLLDLSARLDGSSMYGSESKFSPFWAVGLGWNIHHEKFMENTGISRLKIRGSIGTTGKASFQPYQSQTMFEYIQDGWYATGIGATLMALGNPNLKWETTTAYDLGLDFGMWEDRLTVTFGYYLKKTKNLLSSVTLPTSLGFIDYKENLGQMENEGVELALRSFVYKSNDWNVSLFVNMAHNKNRIVSISNALSSYNDKADQEQANNDDYKTKPMVRYKEGRSSTAIYAMKSLGIDPATGKELFQRQDGTNTYVWDPKESVVCGDTEPKVTGAFGTNITWKQLNLNMNFSYRLGGQVYNQTLINRVENADPRDNVDRRVLEQRWQKPGDHTFYKDINDKSTTPASSRIIQDENVIQLGSLSLSYDLKKEWLKPIGFDMVRLTAMMNDVFRLSTVKRERGISYPFARSMSLGVMVQF